MTLLKLVLVALLMASSSPIVLGAENGFVGHAGVTSVKIILPGVDRVELSRDSLMEAHVYHVHYKGGRVDTLSPDAFAEFAYNQPTTRPRWQKLLNISSVFGVAWVALGLLGQVLFTGRMLIQWVASEKAQRSVVPVSFWWMSLGGATMLILYFVWRKDIVGILGQSAGWMVYSRNLYLIYRKHEPSLWVEKPPSN